MRWAFALALALLAPPAQAGESGVMLLASLDGGYARFRDLNQIVVEYNDSRAWLDHRMRRIRTIGGPRVLAVVHFNRVVVDLSWWQHGATRRADGVDTLGVEGTREVKVRERALSVGLGGNVAGDGNALFAMGVDVDLGRHKEFTRAYAGDDETEWTVVLDEFAPGLTLWGEVLLRLGRRVEFVTGLRPFVHFAFNGWNHDQLEATINPATQYYVGTEDAPLVVGLCAQIGGGVRFED